MACRDNGCGNKGIAGLPELTSDCFRCKGICCTELYFSKLDGFPADKAAGIPCPHLTSDFRCDIHGELALRGLKGCMAYDCLGAGQRAAATGADFHWLTRLHQTLWYLSEAELLPQTDDLKPQMEVLLEESLHVADLEAYQDRVNALLKRCIDRTCKRGRPKGAEFMGKTFHKVDISEMDYSFTLLIAADFSGCSLRGTCLLGADLRGADIRGADLYESLFLTQMQLNGAKGDGDTRLPARLKRPEQWSL